MYKGDTVEARRTDPSRNIRAPRGTALSCKNWLSEAAYRMIQNNLDPEVAERPESLVVYGGNGRRRQLGMLRRNPRAPAQARSGRSNAGSNPLCRRVSHPSRSPNGLLIANSNLVPAWANWEHFHELDRKGLMMYGQMTAGSWIYIGSQGIVQGTYETFARPDANITAETLQADGY